MNSTDNGGKSQSRDILSDVPPVDLELVQAINPLAMKSKDDGEEGEKESNMVDVWTNGEESLFRVSSTKVKK